MPRSPLTESIQKVRRLVTEIQGTLTVDEFNLLLDELVPEPEPEVKQAKKTRKKSSKSSQSSSKSPRASGIHAQLQERRSEQRETVTTKDDDYDPEAERCTFVRGDGKFCYLLSDHNIHHMKTHPEYHEFESGKSDAPPAPVPSSANGGATDSTQNSEASAASAGAVTGGSSDG